MLICTHVWTKSAKVSCSPWEQFCISGRKTSYSTGHAVGEIVRPVAETRHSMQIRITFSGSIINLFYYIQHKMVSRHWRSCDHRVVSRTRVGRSIVADHVRDHLCLQITRKQNKRGLNVGPVPWTLAQYLGQC